MSGLRAAAHSFAEIELRRCIAKGWRERDDELEFWGSVISIAFPLQYFISCLVDCSTDCLFLVSERHLFSSKCCNLRKDLIDIGSLED